VCDQGAPPTAMKFWQTDDRRYAQFVTLAEHRLLRHAFSTRPHDVSARDDDRQAERAARRERMARDLGLDPQHLCYCVQAHQSGIAVLREARAAGPLPRCDAVITNQRSLPLMTFSADCPLVLLFDAHRPALALVHASWRCTVARLVQATIHTMQSQLQTRPEDLCAGIGPSAGPEHYVVGADVQAAAAAAGLPMDERLFPRREGRTCFNLWETNRLLLVEAGVPPKSIEVAGLCTMTRTDLFFSYRREGPGCGHFGLMACLTSS
jgi:YfiH family protein